MPPGGRGAGPPAVKTAARDKEQRSSQPVRVPPQHGWMSPGRPWSFVYLRSTSKQLSEASLADRLCASQTLPPLWVDQHHCERHTSERQSANQGGEPDDFAQFIAQCAPHVSSPYARLHYNWHRLVRLLSCSLNRGAFGAASTGADANDPPALVRQQLRQLAVKHLAI